MKKIIYLLITVLWFGQAWAWNSTGHRLVDAVAYQNLTLQARQNIDQLLESTPQAFPSMNFINAGTWPDQLRQQDITAFDSWHFINLPIVRNQVRYQPVNQQNVVWAITQAEKVLQNPQANPVMRAMFLRFLMHFVADVHQPLHCVSLYSRKFLQGDQGGNLYLIRSQHYNNLHAMWDDSLGAFAKLPNYRGKTIAHEARKLQQQFPQQRFKNQLSVTDPHVWAEESYQLAKQDAYSLPFNSAPTTAYILHGKDVAKQRIVLAGYRLAKLLNQLF